MKMSSTTRRGAAAAFTLIEVLLVLVIIGVLAGLLVVTVGGTQDRAAVDTTRLIVQKIENKLQTYYMHVGHYPTETEGGLTALVTAPTFEDEKMAEKWSGPYVVDKELLDAWGQTLNYEAVEPGTEAPEGVKFKLWSNGPDRQSNTEDDIRNWNDEQEAEL